LLYPNLIFWFDNRFQTRIKVWERFIISTIYLGYVHYCMITSKCS